MNHKGTIQLETDRLMLRRLKLEDADGVFRNWSSDDEVSKFLRWATHKSIEDTRKWLMEEENNYKNIDYYTWGIQLKENGDLIGSISAFFDDVENRYEVGYAIGKNYWRNGYTTEALKRIMDYLINEVGIKKFICKHAKLNPASGAVMRKVGFTYIKDDYYESFDKTKRYDSKTYYLDIE